MNILNIFVKTKVLHFCISRNRPGSILIIDNTSSYQNKELLKIYYKKNILLVYLPLYLPDFYII